MGLIGKLITAVVAALFLAVLREIGVLGAVVDSLTSFGRSLVSRFLLEVAMVVI